MLNPARSRRTALRMDRLPEVLPESPLPSELLRLTQARRWTTLFLRHFLLIGFCFSSPAAVPTEARDQERRPGALFTVRNEATGWWLVSPEGRKFFSLGVCCIHQGTSRDTFDVENPSYAAWQHYPTSATPTC